MLTQLGVCDEATGIRDVTRELQFRIKSFVDRLEKTRSVLDISRQCYQLLDKVLCLRLSNSSSNTWAFDIAQLFKMCLCTHSLVF